MSQFGLRGSETTTLPTSPPDRLQALHDALSVAFEIARAQAEARVRQEGYDPLLDTVEDPAPLWDRLQQRYAGVRLDEMSPSEFSTALDEFALLASRTEVFARVEEARRTAKMEHMRQAHICKFGSEFGTVEVESQWTVSDGP